MNEAQRVLGLDVGERRVGIAVTDALGIAQPLITMGRSSTKEELRNIARLVRKHSIAAMVVGHPRNMDGTTSAQTLKCEAYAALLQEHFTLPVYLQDERLSSHEADAWLDARGYPRGPERKGLLDRVAAMVILQDWLDAQARSSVAHAPVA
jgi:putative Holliday junction resolvase